MKREEIKIIEFDFDREAVASEKKSGLESIKILEFGRDRESGHSTIVTGKDVRDIKIVEFDDDRNQLQQATDKTAVRRPSPAAKPKKDVGKIKIIEFDKSDAEETDFIENQKIKILEFD